MRIWITIVGILWASSAMADCTVVPPFTDGCPLSAQQLNALAPLNSPALTGTPTVNGVPIYQPPTLVQPFKKSQKSSNPTWKVGQTPLGGSKSKSLTNCPTGLPFQNGCPPFASQLNALAPLASPALTGTPTVNGLLIPPVDPGPRGGTPDAGGPLSGLSAPQLNFFTLGQTRFQEINSVTGTIEAGKGLGPRFNLNQCSGCHSTPAVGGTSPATNPQIAVATLDGAHNSIPPFISINGPIREARFKTDGQIHQLFVISGRTDAPGCSISQPDFSNAQNLSFRIPTSLFGLGLVEATPAANLIAAQDVNLMNSLGIVPGAFNRSGNDGTITTFGWKAQNKSLLIFSSEAYNVEQGVTNESFPSEIDDTPSCQFNALAEDTTLAPGTGGGPGSGTGKSDTEMFATFIRFSAPPTPATPTSSTTNGLAKFTSAGCVACHVANQTTGLSVMTGQSNLAYHPYSDFALHSMGVGLADGISQGLANGNQFRTAPLWGAGKRLFFLHDGRTSNIYQAILAHESTNSEANAVISNFNSLPLSDQQDILNFLRSL